MSYCNRFATPAEATSATRDLEEKRIRDYLAKMSSKSLAWIKSKRQGGDKHDRTVEKIAVERSERGRGYIILNRGKGLRGEGDR